MAERKDDIDFIMDDIHKATKAHTRKVSGKVRPVKVRSTIQVARDTYHTARGHHNKAIWSAYIAYRSEIWRAWRNYRNTRRQHLLLRSQAKNVYKLAKLQEKAGL